VGAVEILEMDSLVVYTQVVSLIAAVAAVQVQALMVQMVFT
jgi:hypothetical protein